MIEKKLEVFKILQEEMQNYLQSGKAYECLRVMCEDSIYSLERENIDVVTFSKWKLKARVDGEHTANKLDSKVIQKWIKYEDIKRALN